jgi:hypothetical protein
VWATFRTTTTRQEIIEILASGAMSDADCRRLLISAETQNVRVTTFVILIIRSWDLFRSETWGRC